MDELTYILGAGASFESFPIVKTFPDRLDFFNQVITSQIRGYNNGTKTDLTNFANEIRNHQSFDTYFKKLFHIGNEVQILKAKKILNLYFLWEHLEFPEGSPYYMIHSDSSGNDILPSSKDVGFEKKSLIDNRYDALIAGLIKPISGKVEFFTKINFITWNYDLNLIASLKNFLFPDLSISQFIRQKSNSDNPNIWTIGPDLRVINMNGYFFSERLSNLRLFSHNDDLIEIKNQLYGLKDELNLDNHITEKDANSISFSWENDKRNTSRVASEAVKNSSSVVVVGYTFPLYNRLIDLRYFNSSSLSRTNVFIQDPRATELVDFLKSDFGLFELVDLKLQSPLQSPNICPKTNCDSFFIPNKIFKSI